MGVFGTQQPARGTIQFVQTGALPLERTQPSRSLARYKRKGKLPHREALCALGMEAGQADTGQPHLTGSWR